MKKERNLTDMQKTFLAAMADPANKGHVRTCMNIAGYSATVPPHVVVDALQEELVDVAHKMLASLGVKAVITLGEGMDGPAGQGAKNALNAANSILDRVGIAKKTSDEVNLKVPSGGLFILPAKEKVQVEE